ncbi:Mrp8p KNAG_0H02350 [Huiozyma naganishii CBS 8797]|uniref:Mrp8p n=1 Tax=Huiozyma naganishii (strain ATCC MYA-139 / BCRC 22969 / CBS 8797 / KCTC 17520 / NBRC 10181 / NCYC 3082 / Yp74L-3) TaxID=1071383 RepID=J7R9U7_HUIN7|nr:hypothetical protein KNAG_0H02350 [Kazachstania naganishii CBS 8797]CCK71650.1 hypothetical protein KNAG_0H02350 [Kazachstania naganishii CBS 8797]
MSSELEELRKQVTQLEQLVAKQTKVLSKTGQSVLELQVSNQKRDVDNFGPPTASKTVARDKFDSTEFATNDDIIGLVGELQIELNHIEERSIRRLVNATKTEEKDILAPLPNADGDTPDFKTSFFPKTMKEFIEIDDVNLFKLARFYECLPPTMKEQDDLEKFLDGKLDNLHVNDFDDATIKKELENYKKDQLDDIFNEVARYIGLRSRRGDDIW